MPNPNPLNPIEYNLIGKAIFMMLAECPTIRHLHEDEGVPYKYNTKEVGECLSVFAGGGRMIKENVLGGFTASIDFQIAYKSFPKTNEQIMNVQQTVDDIMTWLKDYRSLPALTDNRVITKIDVSTALPYKDDTDQDGNQVFAADASIIYEAE